MAVENIDTFEHDIAEEIRTKEASITDIASAGGDVRNTHGSSSNLLLMLGLFLILLVIASLVGAIYYYTKVNPVPQAEPSALQALPQGRELSSVSPTLAANVGQNLGPVNVSPYGYTIAILDLSSVFSYMLRNEDAFADEIARAVGSPRDTSTTTDPFIFADVTKSNQNMRVGTSASSTVVYAFANGNTLLISSSTEGILSLKSGILFK
jgi:hypothetical protein